ncbi:MAG TPA: YetF domain-containing protein [Bryobacteraceae bacterium]|nr:YetF domain-containing protein [Bryobacteraceae bacterium]
MDSLFQFQVSPWELILRGTLIYWFLFLLFRFILRRDAGALGLADILVVVLVADAAQNGMAGDSKSVGEAMLLIGTIACWNYFIDWMSFRYPWFARFAEPSVVSLIETGRIQRKNLEKEMLTEEELLSHLRQSGIEDIHEVKHARLEPDGHISVIRVAKEKDAASPNQQNLTGAI